MENKKKNNTLLIVVIVVISLLLVGTLVYFAYDKIFKEDKPIEENKDNKDNTNNDTDEDGVKVVNYDNDNNFVKIDTDKRDIVIKNFDFDGKANELRLKIGNGDASTGQSPMSIYLNDKLVANVKISISSEFYVLDYNNYYVIDAVGSRYENLFILSSDNKIVKTLVGDAEYKINIDTNDIFRGIIYQTTYEKKNNYIVEEYIEKIDLKRSDISSKTLSDKINCKTYTDSTYDCLCERYFGINKYSGQCI